MNRTIIATATILAVAAVAIFGMRTYSQATTASTVTVHDTDVNWDGRINVADMGLVASKSGQVVPAGGRPVREQNLDGNGNIRVAQQGPLDVNVIASGQFSVIQVADQIVVGDSPVDFYTEFVDVTGCRKISLFVEATPDVGSNYTRGFSVGLVSSIDGLNAFGVVSGSTVSIPPNEVAETHRDSFQTPFYEPALAAPYLALRINNLSYLAQATISAWLYCDTRAD